VPLLGVTSGCAAGLVAAGVVLGRHENQAWPFRRLLPLLWLLLRLMRNPATSLQDAENGHVSGEDANADGGDHSNAEDQRHEERNQSNPPLLSCGVQMPPAQLSSTRFFNLPALTLAASDHPDAP